MFVSAYSSPRGDPNSWLDRRFKISDRMSTVGQEINAGFTTYLSMCYILFVNPAILSSVKDHTGYAPSYVQVLTVTALVAFISTTLMGLWPNLPFAIATGLGLNAFVAYTLVGGLGLTWPQACGVIVMEGALVTLAVLFGLRRWIIDAIPLWLKYSIGAGIGLFIATIGLVNAGVVVKGQGTLVMMAPKYNTWPLAIFAGGLMLTAALMWHERGQRRKVALLLGIVVTTIVATIINAINDNKTFTDGSAKIPHHWTWPDFALVGNFNFGVWDKMAFGTVVATVLALMLSDFFDTAGTVTGIAARNGMLDGNGNLPRMNLVLLVDSLGALLGGLFGNSSNTTFIESETGVEAGGRTGLTSVVTGLLFLASLVLSPIAGIVPAVATAPILVIVGVIMIGLVTDIAWDDITIALPALLTILVMPLTYSITNGVGLGFIAFTVVSILTGQFERVRVPMYFVTAVFIWYFVHGIV